MWQEKIYSPWSRLMPEWVDAQKRAVKPWETGAGSRAWKEPADLQGEESILEKAYVLDITKDTEDIKLLIVTVQLSSPRNIFLDIFHCLNNNL